MNESKKPLPSVMSLPLVIVCVLAMIGASALALWLIPRLSQAAAIRGASVAIASFLFTQLGLRLIHARRRRSGRV